MGLSQTITRIDVTGRPFGSTDTSKWRTIETQIRPSSLTDFQAFVATALAYASGATTTGPIFVGEDNSGNKYSLSHQGVAKANLYAEGTVSGRWLDSPERRSEVRLEHDSGRALQAEQLRARALHQLLEHVLKGLRRRQLPRVRTPAGPPVTVLRHQRPEQRQRRGRRVVDPVPVEREGDLHPVHEGSGLGEPQADLRQHAHLRHHVGAVHPADQRCHLLVCRRDRLRRRQGPDHGRDERQRSTTAATSTQNTPGTDVIGEEAQGSLDVPQWAPNVNRNITIYSAQFSLNGAFESSPTWSGGTKGTMDFFGSTAVYGVTPCSQTVGSDCTIIYFSGLLRQTPIYNYDPNLLFVQPPYWPNLGNAFTILVQRQI